MKNLPITLSTLIFLSACSMDDSDHSTDNTCASASCDSPDGSSATCTDERYGDGTCDLDIDCAPPDIDCFVTFEDDAAATEWFSGFEAVLAEEENREPNALLPQSDPRYPRMRELVDRGWEAYQQSNPVGDLSWHRVGLVLVDDPEINAFVVPDLDFKRKGLTVMVNTGLLDRSGTDEQLLGLVLHELQHIIALHSMRGRPNERRSYQVLPNEPEPLGYLQPNDPAAQEALESYLTASEDVGMFPLEELNGVPFPGSENWNVLQLMRLQGDPNSCQDAAVAAELINEFIWQHFRRLDSNLVLNGDGDSLDYITNEYMSEIREVCLAQSTGDIFDFLATLLGKSAEELRSAAPAEFIELVDGLPAHEAVQAITLDDFAKMRSIDALLTEHTGAGIESLRSYTHEENADDATVAVLRDAGLSPTGLADFFLTTFMEPEERAECLAILDSGAVPPYGVDLTDDHHATVLARLARETVGGPRGQG